MGCVEKEKCEKWVVGCVVSSGMVGEEFVCL